MLRNLAKFSAVSLVAVSLLLVGLIGFSPREEAKEVSLEKREVLKEKKPLFKEEPIRIAVAVLVSPRETFGYYRKLLNYVSEELGRPVEYIQKETYAEVIDLMKIGKVDIAFLCGLPYVIGHDDFGLKLFVIPQVNGKITYHSYIIVPIDSPVKTLEELRGKTFAFSDPLSNSGKLVPTYMLAKMGESPESFFKEYVYTKAHDKTIEIVARKLVDGAAVDSLIWDYNNKRNPKFTSKTRIIKISAPYGIVPLGVRPGLDPELKEKTREAFLGIHKTERGREILQGMGLDKFVPIDDTNYDNIRQIKTFIEEYNKNREGISF